MAIYKCKMCGGALHTEEGQSIAVCDFCDTQQTLPKATDEAVANLFNRANHLRLKCEFDKAEQIYERIVELAPEEAEAHWGMVLCRYGIEYVEDPQSLARIPTCHRTSFEAITADADYLSAMEKADAVSRSLYEAEAKRIDSLQKDILAVVAEEKPFDVFLCYKESDDSGKRTPDSVLANDIYYQLTQEGFRVFYAAITLEDKLGQAYEPYIFSALHSAKVMLVIGTKPEYLEAVWVKNEWSRFLKLMKTDRSRLLIPCYRNMDAYDLPEEFSHLQAQNMEKLGFVSDLIRGIKKLIQKNDPQSLSTQAAPSSSRATVSSEVSPLLERALLFLEERDFENADQYAERVLDREPKNAKAYLIKLCARLKLTGLDQLGTDGLPDYDGFPEYQKAVRFADDTVLPILHAVAARRAETNRLRAEEAEALRKKNAEEAEARRKAQEAQAALLQQQKKEEAIQVANAYILQAEFAHNQELRGAMERYRSKMDSCKDSMDGYDADSLQTALKRLRHQISELTERAGKLDAAWDQTSQAKESTGFFAVKRKKELSQRKAQIAEEAQEIEDLLGVLRPEIKRLEAFQARTAEAEKTIARLEQGIQFFEAQCAATEQEGSLKDYKPSLSRLTPRQFTDAMDLLRKEQALEAVDPKWKRHYPTSDFPKNPYAVDTAIDLSEVKILPTYWFGSYQGEALEWFALTKEGKATLLLCTRCVHHLPYHDAEHTDITYEQSYLRQWLNDSFYKNAFSPAQQEHIWKSPKQGNPEHFRYLTPGGSTTTDKVFLLSPSELSAYVDIGLRARTAPSLGGSYEYGAPQSFWLRSPGKDARHAVTVNAEGTICHDGEPITKEEIGVRPALWVYDIEWNHS